VELGDLVKSKKFNAMGIIVEIFGDLDPENPWIRVLFTSPVSGDQWCRKSSLILISTKKDPLAGTDDAGDS
jgi:hypothetical protein